MSHFAVLVIGENPDQQLAPYHEFECTGVDDQYVQEIDITEKVLAYLDEKVSVTRGTAEHTAQRNPNAEEISLRELAMRAGADPIMFALGEYGLEPIHIIDDLKAENLGMSPELVLKQAAKKINRKGAHKHGYAILKGGKKTKSGVTGAQLVKAIRRTNPNARWDGYQLGGRWTGFFKLKAGFDGETGSPGLMTEPAKEGYADSARKGAIDFEGMRAEAEERARKRYASFFRALGNIPFPQTWKEVLGKHPQDPEAAREEYWKQPGIVRVRKEEEFKFDEDVAAEFGCTEQEYVRRARDAALSAFALVEDGQWFERGRMGWFGIVTDENDVHSWQREQVKLLESLSEDTLLSIYDCHI